MLKWLKKKDDKRSLRGRKRGKSFYSWSGLEYSLLLFLSLLMVYIVIYLVRGELPFNF